MKSFPPCESEPSVTKSLWLNFWVLGTGQSSSVSQDSEAVLQLLGSQVLLHGEVGSSTDFADNRLSLWFPAPCCSDAFPESLPGGGAVVSSLWGQSSGQARNLGLAKPQSLLLWKTLDSYKTTSCTYPPPPLSVISSLLGVLVWTTSFLPFHQACGSGLAFLLTWSTFIMVSVVLLFTYFNWEQLSLHTPHPPLASLHNLSKQWPYW